MRNTRTETSLATRANLIGIARTVFADTGYANASMDDFTAKVGLTRGAIYHHFGGKEGLFAAVVDQIDEEVEQRLKAASDAAGNPWEGFKLRCRGYLEAAVEPEVRRIILRDARAVLGDVSPAAQRRSVAEIQRVLEELMRERVIRQADAGILARMMYGVVTEAAFWIAEDESRHVFRLQQALPTLDALLDGMLLQQ